MNDLTAVSVITDDLAGIIDAEGIGEFAARGINSRYRTADIKKTMALS